MAGGKIEIFNLKEDPDRWEDLIEKEIAASATVPESAQVVESMYWEKDRELAFKRFLESLDFQHIKELMQIHKISRKQPLCEIGGGSGQLAWALAQSGYENVELLEPNGRWITGTEYLQSQLEKMNGRLRICNDLGQWYNSEEKYQTIVTRNCVHHFPNIAMVAACIRQKMKMSGRWVMIRESYADDASELYALLRNHPYCQKYQVYEFAFPAKHYADSVEFAGFKLISVVPSRYANNTLAEYVKDEGSAFRRWKTRLQRSLIKRAPWMTVALFRLENFLNRLPGFRLRTWSRPQVMVFQRAKA